MLFSVPNNPSDFWSSFNTGSHYVASTATVNLENTSDLDYSVEHISIPRDSSVNQYSRNINLTSENYTEIPDSMDVSKEAYLEVNEVPNFHLIPT